MMFAAVFTGLPAAVLLFLCEGLVSYRAAVWALPEAGVCVRFCAAAVIGWWVLEVAFYALAFSHHFHLTAALVVWLVPAVVAAARWDGSAFAADRRELRAIGAELARGSNRVPLLVVAVVLSLYIVRGLVSPVIAWDALTYHLVHAARWIQHGGFAAQNAPDAWGYYEYFPYAGEVLWAWAMLPLRGDALLAPVSALLVALVGLSAFASARALHVNRDRSLLVALSIVATPAVLAFTGSAYVDTTTLAGFGLGVLFLTRAASTREHADYALSAIAFGLYAAVKPSGLPVFAVAMGFLAWSSMRRQRGFWGVLKHSAVIVPVAAAPLLLQAIPTWLRTGSPLYPLPLNLLGTHLFVGNRELEALLDGTIPIPGSITTGIAAFLRELFLPVQGFLPHLNFAPSGLFLLALGLPGLLRMCARRDGRIPGVFLLLVTALTVAMISSPSVAALRNSAWVHVTGRLLTPGLFSLAIAAGLLFPSRSVDAVWRIVVMVSAWYSIPRGISPPEAVAMLFCFGGGALLIVILRRAWRRCPGLLRPAPALACALLVSAPVGAGLHEARGWLRNRVYAAAAEGDSFVLHPLDHRFAAAWPIWRWLDQSSAQRIAVVSGWDGVGHNAYRFPLFGSRLQHEVLYVSPSCSGAVIDYELDQSVRAAADFHCWLRALIAADVDVVVALAPRTTIESAWLVGHPEFFQLAAQGSWTQSLAFRFDRRAAREALTIRAAASGGRTFPVAGRSAAAELHEDSR